MSPEQQPTAELQEGSLSIGRAPGNGWVLNDPRKFISNRHCHVEARSDGFYLTDTSSNGVFLNHPGNRLPAREPARIADGDRLLTGDFEIELRIEQALPVTESQVAEKAKWRKDRGATGAKGTPGAGSAPVTPAGPLEKTSRQEASAGERGTSAPSASGSVRSPATAVDEARRADEADARGPERDQPLEAFLEGAGVGGFAVPGDQQGRFLYHAGRLFRELIAGVIDALRARSLVKGEMRFDQTMLRPIENNPLKFSIDFEGTLKIMLTEKRGGCLNPVDAVREAGSDLVTHNLAMAAAQQEVLGKLLRRFDPAEIELMDESQGILQEILPATKKARYWDEYKNLYERLRREMEDEGGQLLSREYTRAYEEQVRLLKEKRAREGR